MNDLQIAGTQTIAVSNFRKTLPAEIVKTLPIAVQQIAAAKHSRYIVDFDIKELQNRLLTLIASSFQYAGQTVAPRDLAGIVEQLQRELVNYPWLHFAELELFIRNGINEAYGAYFGINPKSIIHWIGAGRISEDSKRYAAELARTISSKSEPTEEQKDAIGRELALKTFEDFSAGKDITMPSVTVYDYLDAKCVIIFSKEQKFDFWNKAAESLKISLSNQVASSNNKLEINKLKTRIADIAKLQNNEDGLSDEETAKALQKNEAKRLALKSFFEDLVTFEQELLIH